MMQLKESVVVGAKSPVFAIKSAYYGITVPIFNHTEKSYNVTDALDRLLTN